MSLVETRRGVGLVAAVTEFFAAMTQAVHDARQHGGA